MSNIRIVLLYLLYIVIIGGITTAIVLSLHSGSDNRPKTVAKPATSQGKQYASVSGPKAPATPTQPTQPASPSSSSSQSSASSSSTRQSATGTSAANAGSSAGQSLAGSNQQLVNTGPGDVVGLFVGATIVGFVVHRRLLIRL